MQALWLSLRDIPAQGREFSFSDPAMWAGPAAEFKLGVNVVTPLEATLRVQLHGDGCLMSGRISGVVAFVCDCCLDEARVEIDVSFDEFEELPPAPPTAIGRTRQPKAPAPTEAAAAQDLGEEERLLRWTSGSPELNVAVLLWEQFVLALPVKPVCRPDCQGLCPHCGQTLNAGPCGCSKDEGDPRLSALRGLKIERS